MDDDNEWVAMQFFQHPDGLYSIQSGVEFKYAGTLTRHYHRRCLVAPADDAGPQQKVSAEDCSDNSSMNYADKYKWRIVPTWAKPDQYS